MSDGVKLSAVDGAVALADELTALQFEIDPLHATLVGVPGHDRLLADRSSAAERIAVLRLRELADRADALRATGSDGPPTPAAGVGDGDRDDSWLTLAVVAQQARAWADRLAARAVEYTICDNFDAPAAEMLTLLPMIAIPDAGRARDYLARLEALPGYLAAVAGRHREGLAAGRLPVRTLVEAAVAHLDRYLADPEADPLLRPEPPADLPSFPADRGRVLERTVRPAFRAYRGFLADEVVGRARPDTEPGLCFLPDGDAMYASLVRMHTTTDHSPDDLHRTGLDLVARLAGEYATIGARHLGTGDVTGIFGRLREDPALRWRDGEELLAAARGAVARAEAAAPNWFGRLPSQNCLVEPVPAGEAAGAAAAYYMPPSLDGLRPGVYYANIYGADQRSRYAAEATAFHEAVPGHHFQNTIALELTHLPLLRRIAGITAYAEGWGLYCERLAAEMGLYSGDMDLLGMLSLDSMRACRLVVDTGLHAKGWSRQRAIDYMVANSPLALLEIESEVDRYIAAPGQALAYMVGRLEIQRIRAGAERDLGDRFDVRAFHDHLLGGGELPMTVLAESVSRWVATRR